MAGTDRIQIRHSFNICIQPAMQTSKQKRHLFTKKDTRRVACLHLVDFPFKISLQTMNASE